MTAEALLDELARPDCYPSGVREVHIVQTHLSVVCITDERVFKLKKAVRLPFVDFTSLAARRQACRDEVTLNRRLCPDVYLGTAALRRVDGVLRFAAIGDDERREDLDVAVVMRRLPQERMLDVLVAEGGVGRNDMSHLAAIVARFHREAERGAEVTRIGHPDRLAAFAAANFAELTAVPEHGLPLRLLDAAREASARAFEAALPTLRARADDGRIVDGHGDLHARNVCMTSPPVIYDCIEFEPAFRCGDVATEVAFLAMDLRYRRANELANAFVDAYVEHSGDRELPALLPLLSSYRAMVRGKVAAFAAAEPEVAPDDRQRARTSALEHLRLAAACLVECDRARWIVVCGPPASGKTGLASALAYRGRWPHVATDRVRK
ncbi:MAG TPA: hypothetical protein ENI87_11230, partial [bacterium]|nr:hypothetical protein [bacterium]